MVTRPAQPARTIVGKRMTQRQHLGVQRNDPHTGAPPGRLLAAAGLASLLLLAGCGSGGGSADVRCSGGQCRAVVTGTPVEVSEPGTSGSMAMVLGTSTSRPKPTSSSRPTTSRTTTRTTTRTARGGPDQVDFVVRTVGPGWVEIDEDGVRRIPVGEAFAEDDRLVRVESSDGRTAVFVWPSAP